MLSIASDAGFVSSYLPVNAGIRALVGLIADPNWSGPLLAAAALIATFGVARRLWPAHPEAAAVSALLMATSPQFLVTSMTSYAMTAHLALNMIWLWFFLRDDKFGHGAAIITGFFASGLHQLIFHPLFAAPFIVRLWLSSRRLLAATYIAAYALICFFWIAYWSLALGSQGITTNASDDAGLLYFVATVWTLVRDFQWAGFDLMLKNLLRFFSWDNPILLPLMLLSYPAVRRDSGIARELAAGLLLTLVAVFILMPYQGHGWGYRYLHGLLGSAAFLGGYAWVALSNRGSEAEMAACRAALVVCSAVALFLLLPVHAKQAHDFVAPYARASAAIQHANTDVVIVDKSSLLFAEDLVRNDPFLRNRAKVLDLTNLTEPGIDYLCHHKTVTLFGYSEALSFGISPNAELTLRDDDTRKQRRADLARLDCGTSLGIPAQKGLQQP